MKKKVAGFVLAFVVVFGFYGGLLYELIRGNSPILDILLFGILIGGVAVLCMVGVWRIIFRVALGGRGNGES